MASHHVVRKQIFDVTIRQDSHAHVLQERLQQVHKDRLAGIIDEALSSVAGDGEVIRLDRIDVELGVLSSADLEEQLVRRIRSELGKALRGAVTALQGRHGGQGQGRIQRMEKSRLERIRVFLETGSLPWWAPQAESPALENQFLQLIETEPAEVAGMLRSVLTSTVAKRIVKQFSRDLMERLVAVLVPSAAVQIQGAIADWGRLLRDAGEAIAPGTGGSLEAPAFMDLLFEAVLTYLADQRGTVTSAEGLCVHLTEHFFVDVGHTEKSIFEALAAIARQTLTEDSHVRVWFAKARRPGVTAHLPPRAGVPAAGPWETEQAVGVSEPSSAIESVAPAGRAEAMDTGQSTGHRSNQARVKPGDQNRAGETQTTGEAAFIEGTPQSRRIRRAPEQRSIHPESGGKGSSRAFGSHEETMFPGPGSSAQVRDRLDRDQAHYIENAGLAILWPYLARFFRNIGLLEDKAFSSEPARERAVLVLQHLATGQGEWPEHRLLLNKLLCGWPPCDPVAKAVDLTDADVEASNELLTAIIGHWQALKRTSVGGFRRAFLQREGRIACQENGWQLKVQRVGYDVLLDRLPWGIGFVLLPWMETPVFVEW
jgi:hypothetical protein